MISSSALFRILKLATFFFFLALTSPPAGAAPGTLEETFQPGIHHSDFAYRALAQPDGRVLVAGSFLTVGGKPQGYFARLMPNGDLDEEFAPTFDSNITGFSLQRDGKILVAGSFTEVNGTPRQTLARLNADGSLDLEFAPQFDGPVRSLLLQWDGKIVVSGSFTTLNGEEVTNGVRLHSDGSRDESFSFSTDGHVLTMAPNPDGGIYLLSGTFTYVNGLPKSWLARLKSDGSLDSDFDPSFDNLVRAVVVQPNGSILVAGQFTKVNNVVRNRVARLLPTGLLDPGFNANVSSTVLSLALQADGKMVIGGGFNSIGGMPRPGVARLNANGTLDSSFDPFSILVSRTSAALQQDGRILTTGGLSRAGPSSAHNVERHEGNPATGSLVATSTSRVAWMRGGGAPELTTARVEFSGDGGATWQELGQALPISGGWELTGLNLPAAGTLRASGIFMGGQNNSCSTWFETVAGYGGSAPEIVIEGPSGVELVDGVGQVTLPSNRAWHTFVVRNTGTAPLELAMPRLTSVWSLPNEFQFDVRGMRTIVPAGENTTFKVFLEPFYENTRITNFSIANNDPLKTPFDIQIAGPGAVSRRIDVQGMELHGINYTDVYYFQPTFAPAVPHHQVLVPNNLMTGYLALFDYGYPMHSVVSVKINGVSPAVGAAGQILLSREKEQTFEIELTAPDGVTSRIYSLDVKRRAPEPGDVDLSFGAGGGSRIINGTVSLPNGQIMLFGSFSSIQGVNQRHLMRLNADGTVDSSFAPVLNSSVEGVDVQPDGKLLIRGSFTFVNGKSRPRWARLLPDGALDETLAYPTLNTNSGIGTIRAIAVQNDGKILIAGNFTSADDLPRPGFVRLNTNGTVDSGFVPSSLLIDRIAIQSDGGILCAGYIQATDTGVVRRLNSDGSFEPYASQSADGRITAIAIQPDGKILIGGSFTKVGGVPRNGMARLNEDLQLDASYAPNVGTPTGFCLRADGKVFVARPAPPVRLSPGGAVENAFNPNRLGATSLSTISSAMMTNEGPVFAGSLGSCGGVSAEGFVRLHDVPPEPIPSPHASNASSVTWQTSMTAPAAERVLFQVSTDAGATWQNLGMGGYSGGMGGAWSVQNIVLPATGKVRALAFARSGLNNGSEGISASPAADFSFGPAFLEVLDLSRDVVVHGESRLQFGSVSLRGSKFAPFFLRNTGEMHLNLGEVSIYGPNANSFQVTRPPQKSLRAGEEVELAVVFSPTSLGVKKAFLRIKSSDINSPTFEVVLEGTGVPVVAAVAKTLPATVFGHDSAALAGTVDDKGFVREVVFDWGLTSKLGTTVSSIQTDSNMFSAYLPGLQPHTKYHYRIRAAGYMGGGNGAVMSFTTQNRAPVAVDDSFTITGDFPVLFQPLTNDTDPDSDSLTLVSVTLKTPGLSKVAKAGNAVQVTVADAGGITFEYQVADGFGGKATAMATVVKMPLVSIVSPMSFEAIGGTYQVSYAPGQASLGAPRSPAAWLKVSPSPLRVTAAPNLSKRDRSATLDFGGGLVLQVTQSGQAPAYLNSVPDVAATVGLAFSQAISGGDGPLTITASNLPPGLRLDTKSPRISGVPTKAGVYNVLLKARNSVGTASEGSSFTITVEPAPEQVIGSFHGFIARDGVLNSWLGSRLEFTATATGVVTGKVVAGAKGQAFKGAFTAVPGLPNARQLSLPLPASDGSQVPLVLVVNGTVANAAKGTFGEQPVTAWRQIWRTGTLATTFKGAHSFYLVPPEDSHLLPQGYGFGAFTVDEKTGALMIAGKLADDSGLTSSTFAGPQGQVLVYQSLYGNRGSFAGVLSMSANHRVSGAPTWYKAALPLGVSLADLMYRDGFGPEIYVATGGELPAVAPGGIIAGLTKIANNAWFEFRRGGLEIEEAEFDIGVSLMNYGATGLTNTAIFPSDNPFTVTLKQIKTAAGSYSGDFILPGLSGAPNRKITFQGQFVNDGVTSRGYGFFILPQPAATVPLLRSSLRASGIVLLRERLPGDG